MSHPIPYRIELPASPAMPADTVCVDSLGTDSLIMLPAEPQVEHFPFQALTDLTAQTTPESHYRTVSPEELFGYGSMQAEIPFLRPHSESPTATTSFSLLVLAILCFYCLMLYQHLADAVLLCSRVSHERATGERLSEDSNGGYNRFLGLCTLLGVLLVGVATMRYTAPLLEQTALGAWPHSGAFLGAVGIAAALGLVALYGAIIRNLVGRLTYTLHLFEQLVLIKRTFFAMLTLFATPFMALWLLTPQGEGRLWFWVIIIELIITLILYLQETFSLFISKKISILHWFLYLCGVEIFPISFLVLMAVR